MQELARALLGLSALGPELVGEERIPKEKEITTDVALITAELRRGPNGLVDLVRDVGKTQQRTEPFNLLIVVDQFEEIFTYINAGRREADESEGFVNLLLTSRTVKDAGIFVVLTMRTDFLGNCVRFLDLPDAINRGQYLTPRLNRDQTEWAIRGPARLFGGDVEPTLVAELINSIGDDPDQLPILQHALARMWESARARACDKPIISWNDFKDTGGIHDALSSHAEQVLASLGQEQQRLAKILFRAITEQREVNGGSQAVRRPQSLAQIAEWSGQDWTEFAPVVRAFAQEDVNFVHYTEPLNEETVIDISHESLIRKWHSLGQWVKEEAESAEWFRRVARAAQLRIEGREGLWRDPALQFVLDKRTNEGWNKHWAKRYSDQYESADEFLEASRREREREAAAKQEQEKRELTRTKQFLYVANLNLAQKEFAEGYIPRGQELLNNYLPDAETAGEDDVRSFYWYFLWNANHQELSTFRWQQEKHLLISLLTDGETVVSGSWQGVKLWTIGSSEEPANFSSDGTHVAISRDGKKMATVGWDNTVKLWDREQRRELKPLSGHDKFITSLAFSSDGKTLATASFDNTIKLWDLHTYEERATLKIDTMFVNSMVFSSHDSILAVISWRINLWDLRTNEEIRIKGYELTRVSAAAFSPDGKTLGLATSDGTVRLWNVKPPFRWIRTKLSRFLAPYPELLTFKAHENNIDSLAFSPDGQKLATASGDGTVKLWDIASEMRSLWKVGLAQFFSKRQQLATLKGHEDTVKSVAFSSNGEVLVTASPDGTAKLWETETSPKSALCQGDLINSLTFSPDGKTLVTVGSWGETVKRWSVETSSEIVKFKGPGKKITKFICLSPDGQLLAIQDESRVRLWNIQNEAEFGAFETPEDKTSTITISPDGRMLGIGTWNSTIRLFNIQTQQELPTLKADDAVRSLAFSPDGTSLAAGTAHIVKLWNIERNEELITFKGHEDLVQSVSFSGDGKILATGSNDRTIRLWDLDRCQEISILKGHWGIIQSLAFSPDRKTLVTGSSDRTVKLWDLNTFQELATFKAHEEILESVLFSPDGKTLASRSSDGFVKFWFAATEAQVTRQRG
jgi:WD40 repeat protein